MADSEDDTDDKQGRHEPPDAGRNASVPAGSYAPHPLLPSEAEGSESRDIYFIEFRRRRSDGGIDVLCEDFPLSEVQSWAEVVRPWGGGEYKVIAKDKNHHIVAWFPKANGEWIQVDGESKPFTLPGRSPRPDPLVASFPRVPEPPRPPRKRSVIELCSLCHPRMTVCGKAG